MSKKVFVLAPKEDWIIDRFVHEWSKDNSDITVSNPESADVIWLLADFCWQHIPRAILKSRKIIITIHHIVPSKFGANEKAEFSVRDQYINVYHVPNKRTYDFVKTLTSKPIYIIGYWANSDIWHKTDTKNNLRTKHGLSHELFLCGSFQRDTEGFDLKSPKLEKGPDLLADYLENLFKTQNNLHVILAGWRRQYIISRLKNEAIPFSYFELPTQTILNELYQTLDLYPVASRFEGGPQSLIECGLLGVPVVSRKMGIAEQVLSPNAINDDLTSAIPEIPNVELIKIPQGYDQYRNMIQSI